MILGKIARFFDDPGSEPHLILYLEEPVYYAILEFLYRSAPERQQHQYNPITCRLKIRGMSRPVHNALARFASRTYGEMIGQGWITAEERSQVDIGVQSVKLSRSHFRVGDTVKKIPAWEKTPDGVFNFEGPDGIVKPMVVWEVGFSENLEDLRSDVGQWLVKAGGKTRVVVMVDIQEDQTACQDRRATQAFKLRLSELLRDFGNEKAKLKLGIEVPEVDVDREDVSGRDADSDTSFSS